MTLEFGRELPGRFILEGVLQSVLRDLIRLLNEVCESAWLHFVLIAVSARPKTWL